jgi:hypothetical protein
MSKIIPDDEFAMILIRSLPPSYKSKASQMVTSADMNNTDITSKTVIKMIGDEYDARARESMVNKLRPEAFKADNQKETTTDAPM